MLRPLLNVARSLLIFLVLICFNGCVKQAEIPPTAADTIKYYQRKAVYPGGLSKTDFSVNPDDYTLVLASGKVKTPRPKNWVSFRPYSCLFMKYGEWMLISPDGYYACSPEGNTLLYWISRDGMETFAYEQFESLFKRPGDSIAGCLPFRQYRNRDGCAQ